MQRPGFLNLPLTGEALGLLTDCAEREPSSAAGAFLLWSRYFGSFAPAAPEQALAEAHHILKAASARQASQKSSAQNGLPLLRCLLALHAILQGNRQQGLQELRRLEKDNLEPVAARLLAALPHADLNGTETLSALKGAFGGQADSAASRESFLADLFQDSRARQEDSLEEPDDERLHRSLALSSLCPRLLADYLWQGLVCNEGTSWQDNWFNAMDDFLVPEERYTSYMEGLLCLHGFGGRIRDADRALALLARSAQAHFGPAAGLLADITGRGLCGCTADPWQGIDWVAEGCRHLAPRALAVQGLLNMSSGERLTSTTRLLSATREELFDWCGRQDQDCLCQACNAVFRLEVLVRQGARLDDPEAGLEANEAGDMLADALCLAQATADAGTFLYAGRELVRLATESLDDAQSGLRDRDKDRINAWGDRTASPVLVRGAETCLVHLTSMSRRKTRPPKPTLAPCLPLLAFFCLDRARFFGEPGAEDLLASFSRTMDTKLLMDNVEARNLNTPLRCFWCKTEHLIL